MCIFIAVNRFMTSESEGTSGNCLFDRSNALAMIDFRSRIDQIPPGQIMETGHNGEWLSLLCVCRLFNNRPFIGTTQELLLVWILQITNND
jgi:hypothetical protein